jgi:hypothetical protein
VHDGCSQPRSGPGENRISTLVVGARTSHIRRPGTLQMALTRKLLASNLKPSDAGRDFKDPCVEIALKLATVQSCLHMAGIRVRQVAEWAHCVRVLGSARPESSLMWLLAQPHGLYLVELKWHKRDKHRADFEGDFHTIAGVC